MPTDYDTALAEVHRQLFGPPAAAAAAPTAAALVVAHEGQPVGPAAITADQRFRDFVRRLMDSNYRATEQPLPD
jgi:hypothetical protein